MPDTLTEIRERHRYVEGHNADGDERSGCICGELWRCDAAALLAYIDALTAAANEVLEDLAYGKPAEESSRILAAILRGER